MKTIEQYDNTFSLILIGHAYGKHTSYYNRKELIYPAVTLQNNINYINQNDFAIFLGDIVEKCEDEYFITFKKIILEKINIPNINVYGNHENCKIYHDYNKTLQTFSIKDNLFILIPYMKEHRNVVDKIWNIIKLNLDNRIEYKNYIILSHQVLNVYFLDKLLQNYSSSKSNDPILLDKNIQINKDFYYYMKRNKNKFYFISGDVGSYESFPALYFNEKNKYFISTGLYENSEDNFIKMNFNENEITIELINIGGVKRNIKDYSYEKVLNKFIKR